MNFLKKIGRFFISKQFWINIGLIILFWVVLIWGMLSYLDSTTDHDTKIEVPTLISSNFKDIDVMLEGKDLNYIVLDSVYKPDLVEGTIIYQDPRPTDTTGQYVKNGRQIKLRVSKQTRFVDVPHLSGDLAFVEGILVSRGLRSKISFVPSAEDVNAVITAKIDGVEIPEGGMRVPIRSVVQLTVGKSTGGQLVTVPNLNGLTIKEAQSRLKNMTSLNLFITCADCLTKADSLSARINSQTPIAEEGSQVPVGSTITAFATLNFTE